MPKIDLRRPLVSDWKIGDLLSGRQRPVSGAAFGTAVALHCYMTGKPVLPTPDQSGSNEGDSKLVYFRLTRLDLSTRSNCRRPQTYRTRAARAVS
jgi:hypothetical protein